MLLEVFHREIRTAHSILGAQQFAELFERVIKLGTDRIAQIDALRREEKELWKEKDRLGIRPGDEAFAVIAAKSLNIGKEEEKLSKEFLEEQKKWRAEFLALSESPATKIERNIKAYVDAHPEEFFRD